MITILLAIPLWLTAVGWGDPATTPTAITGQVVDQVGSPVPLATISLVQVAGGVVGSTTSDLGGHFRFEPVGSGRYFLRGEKAGFVHPQWAVGEPSRLVHVVDGSTVQVTVRLRRGAVISGTVRGPTGAPVGGATAYLLRCDPIPGRCREDAKLSRTSRTGAHGTYRLSGLPPGEYVVGVRARLSNDTSPISEAPDDLIAWAERRLAGSNAAVERSAASEGRTVNWLPAFFPAAATSLGATRISIRADEIVSDVDVQLMVGAVGRLSGHVVSPSGRMPKGLMLLPDELVVGAPCPPTVLIGPRGEFSTSPCGAGPYRLVARSGEGGSSDWAELRYSQGAEDQVGIPLVMQPTIAVDVAVSIVDSGNPEPHPERSQASIELVRSDVPVKVSGIDIVSGDTDAAGRVVIRGLLPGAYDVQLRLAGQGLWAKSMLAPDGVDVLDAGLGLLATSVGRVVPLRLQLAPVPSTLTGTLVDGAGQPAIAYGVVAFPADQRLWSATRRIKATTVEPDGRFRFEGLPEGDYLLGAVGTFDRLDLTREFLAELAEVSQPATVVWGAETRQNLRIK